MRGVFFDNVVAVVLSLLLHLAMGALLIIDLPLQMTPHSPSAAYEPMIQAVVVDQAELIAETERRKAEQEAQRRAAEVALLEAQEKARLMAEAQRKAEQEARLKAEAEAEAEAEAQRQAAQMEARRKAEAEAQRKAEQEARLKAEAEAEAEAEAQRRAAEVALLEAQEKARLIAEAQRKAEQEARLKAEAEAQRKAEAEAEAQRKAAAEAEAQRKAAAEAEAQRKAAAEARQLAEFRQQLQASLEQEIRNRQVQDEITKYTMLIKTRVERNWLRPPGCQKDLYSKIKIVLGPDDAIESVNIVESSGNPNCDRYIEAAVLRAAPLPLPSEEQAKAAFRSFYFEFNPGG